MKNILFSKSGEVTLKDINRLAQDDIMGLVEMCEGYYDGQLNEVCSHLCNNPNYKIVLIAGPSGSGKTTTARKLSEKLINKGKQAVYVSLDDFFKNRDDLPILENGETDFESVNTLDVAEIRKCFGLLLSKGKAVIPYFDFVLGKRHPEKTTKLEIGENGIVIVEGLHAINPELTNGIDAFGDKGFYKIYVNPQTRISDENDEPVLRKRSLRLMRRMIRDYFFRGSSLENTLMMWQGVCREEIKTIIPFKETADKIVDTTHFYEFCVYHHFLLPIIAKSGVTKKEHKEILDELTEKLELFYDVSADVIPKNSMIREFIGEMQG